MRKAIAYYRVSTQRQGQSGLGLEAQRLEVGFYAVKQQLKIVESYQDIESGKENNRPGLEQALSRAKQLGARLLIAKIDRLSRNAGFVLALRDSGVDFVAVDMPEANTLTIGVMALLAQQERELISTRTKAALAARKARGKKIGNPQNLTPEAMEKGRAAWREKAHKRAAPSIRHAANYWLQGWSLSRIAGELNKSGQSAPMGGLWTPTQVRRLLLMATQCEGILSSPWPRKTA